MSKIKKLKKIKHVLLPAVVCLLCLLLPGCWDAREINDLAITLAIGLDRGEDGVDLTMQFGRSGLSQGGISGGETSGSPFLTILNSGKTISEAYSLFVNQMSREIFMPKNQFILLGEELAAGGVMPHLDFFTRDRVTRPDLPLVVMEGRAADALETDSDLENVPSINIIRTLESQEESSISPKINFLEFISYARSKELSALLPLIRIVEDEAGKRTQAGGAAVFKRDIMVGKLNIMETRGALFLQDKIDRGQLQIQDASGFAALDIVDSNTDISAQISPEGKLIIDARVITNCKITQVYGFQMMKQGEIIEYIGYLADQEIGREIFLALNRAKEMEADFLLFGRAFEKHFPKQWKNIKKDWAGYFQAVELNLKVNTTVVNIGKVAIDNEVQYDR